MVLMHSAATLREREAMAADPLQKIEFVSMTGIFGPGHNKATIKVLIDGTERVLNHEEGVGPVEAICRALADIECFHVVSVRTASLSEGASAVAEAIVTIRYDVSNFVGTAKSANTLDATARAFIDALNNVFAHRERTQRETVFA